MGRLWVAGCGLLAAMHARQAAIAANNPLPPTRNRRQLLVLLALLLAACQRDPQPYPHEAYIWQRQWTPAVSASLRAQTPQFTGWRVLALQVSGTHRIATTPELSSLAAAALPVRVVVRIEGARSPLPVAALWIELEPLLARWRAAGVDVAGVEIDHDCASAALLDYAQWLRELRRTLPATASLSITALPTWMESPDLESLLASVDASVLQVHAVQRPERGLFDADRAHAWVRAWDRRSPHPFAVALPAYGVRVAIDADGLRAVDAEGDIDRSGAGGVELRADPRAVAALIARLRDDPPAQLASIVWFRLPVPGDQRGWSAATLEAVISGAPLQSRFVVTSTANHGGSFDLMLRNAGTLDAPAPDVDLPAHCHLGDALGRYRLQRTSDTLRLAPGSDTWLTAGGRMSIGWMRCDQTLPREWVLP